MSKTSMEIHKSDMCDEMQSEALQVALLALNMYEDSMDIAVYIRTEFERKHGGTWSCIVGSCDASVTYKLNSYINFSAGGKKILLFRTD
ncbi:hypothetical protein ABG768_027020 [Culter alburnus]|uniref:Dynein light chain n=1 Tax=Culter alburnus TaxID=194366 RepID=A0AAW2ADM6_CULAL